MKDGGGYPRDRLVAGLGPGPSEGRDRVLAGLVRREPLDPPAVAGRRPEHADHTPGPARPSSASCAAADRARGRAADHQSDGARPGRMDQLGTRASAQ